MHLRLAVGRATLSIALVLGFACKGEAQVPDRNASRANGYSPLQITENAKLYMEMASTPHKVKAYFSNYTRMSHDNSHGTQVEYNAPDGRSYLWYPGSRTVTPGHWKVAEGLAPDQIHHYVDLCYLYSAASIDPTNNSRGGNWECNRAWFAMIRTKERMAGNPFRLGFSPQTPFILPPDETDLANLLGKVRR